MNSSEVKTVLEERGVEVSSIHVDATAAVVSGLLRGTAERFAQLPLEAEPSGYPAELQRNAP